MIPLIEREIVYKNKWISSEEFLDIISIAQSAPGLIAVNVSIFVGHRIAGIKGSIVATIGSVMPPFIIILLVAAVFTTFKDNQTYRRPGLPHGSPEPPQLDYRQHRRGSYRPHRIPEDLAHLDHRDSHRGRTYSGLQPAGQGQ